MLIYDFKINTSGGPILKMRKLLPDKGRIRMLCRAKRAIMDKRELKLNSKNVGISCGSDIELLFATRPEVIAPGKNLPMSGLWPKLMRDFLSN